MKKRLITGIILMVVLVPLLIVDELLPLFQFVAAGFVCVGAFEMIKLYEHHKKFPTGVKVVIVLSALLTYFCGMTIWAPFKAEIAINPELTFITLFDAKVGFALLFLSIAMQLSLLVFSKTFDAIDIGKSLAASFYVGFGVASLLALRLMGVRLIVYLFMITILTDVFAYVFGMLFGKHKMIERISPKKTWEGAIGGTIVATVAATLFAFLYKDLFVTSEFETIFDGFVNISKLGPTVSFIIIFVVTLFTSVAGQIGDLVASRLKRTFDVKDFSNIFPGHGGFLDRFDSSIVASIVLLSLFLILSSLGI